MLHIITCPHYLLLAAEMMTLYVNGEIARQFLW